MSIVTKDKARPRKVTMAIVKEALAGPQSYEEALKGLLQVLGDVEGLSIIDPATGSADFVVMARGEYERLVEEAEDRAATEAYHRAAGEERVPAEVVDRLLAGESPIRVWREHRRMTLDQLGAATGLSKGYLSDLENGKRAGPVETLHTIARALGVSLDELAPAPDER